MRRKGDQEKEPPEIEKWLKRVDGCCRESNTAAKGRERFTVWPSEGDFEGLMLHVGSYCETRGSPTWKTFKRFDRRMSSLRLVLRVNSLVERAKHRLAEAGESCLAMLERQAMNGRKDAASLLRDITRVRSNLKAAKDVVWDQHEKALAQFSRTHTVELACGLTAPPEIRCYARALELMVENYQQERQTTPTPLISWLDRIGHPAAQQLLALENIVAVRAKQRKQFVEEWEAERLRKSGRERVRRYRAKKCLPKQRYTAPS